MRKASIFVASLLLSFVWILPEYTFAEEDKPTDLLSETYILIDATTGEVLAEDDPHKKMYPASITKIVTALLAIESGDLEEKVTISKKASNVDGTRVYLVEGEQMTLKQLVQGLMINSGNDAAVAIAEHLSGSVEQFAKDMNAFVENRLNLQDTHFVNPNGLYEENHYTTASDMAKITQYAMNLDKFKEIVRTKELSWKGKGWETTLYNHHKLLWRYDGVNGVKNGYTSQSQHTLVTSAKRNNTSLIAVTMKSNTSEQAYQDTVELLNYGFDHFRTEMIEKGTILTDKQGNEVEVKEDKIFTYKIGEGFKTMVDEGDLIITNELNEEIASFPLIPDINENNKENIKATMGKADVENDEKDSLKAILLLCSIVLFVIFMIVSFFRKLRRRKRRRLRKQRMIEENRRFRYRG